MAKARRIRRHVRSIRNIRTITRTMEMVATALFKRWHDAVVGARAYTDRMTDLVADLVDRGGLERIEHPLLGGPEELRRDVMLVVTTSRGLCGGHNAGVLRVAVERVRQLEDAGYEVLLHVAGRKGIQRFRQRGVRMERTYEDFEDVPDQAAVTELADGLMGDFLAGRIGGVEVAYMQFVSSGRQRPAIAQVLPLSSLEPPRRLPGAPEPVPYEAVPSAGELLGRLLPETVRMRIYQCFLDSCLSEQSARIAAMRSATENADEMIRDLTVQYNRSRQAQITTELAEIMAGQTGSR